MNAKILLYYKYLMQETPISQEEVISLSDNFFTAVFSGEDYEKQEQFFLYPNPIIYIPHGHDLTLEENIEFNNQFIWQAQETYPDVLITPLLDNPIKARCQFAIYMEGQLDNDEIVRLIIGQDWIVQREGNDLKIVLCINAYHHFLPGSVILEV